MKNKIIISIVILLAIFLVVKCLMYDYRVQKDNIIVINKITGSAVKKPLESNISIKEKIDKYFVEKTIKKHEGEINNCILRNIDNIASQCTNEHNKNKGLLNGYYCNIDVQEKEAKAFCEGFMIFLSNQTKSYIKYDKLAKNIRLTYPESIIKMGKIDDRTLVKGIIKLYPSVSNKIVGFEEDIDSENPDNEQEDVPHSTKFWDE